MVTHTIPPAYLLNRSPPKHSLPKFPPPTRTKLIPSSTGSPLMFVTDVHSQRRYLVDTGSSVSILPAGAFEKKALHPSFDLLAANGSMIGTYGAVFSSVNLHTHLKLQWTFIVADVTEAILGIDFLQGNGFHIDLKREHLYHQPSHTKIKGKSGLPSSTKVCTVQQSSVFHRLLDEFPELTRLDCSPNVTSGVKHHIETFGAPAHSKCRRLSPEKLAAAKEEFRLLLDQGIIRPSKSPWASPIHMVSKASPDSAQWRICGDYRKLNEKTKPDKYTIPHLQEFHWGLHDKTIFSKIDLTRAYHQIPVAREDVEKTAVITPFGLFEYVKMSFGLKNAAQTMQRFMDNITRDLPFVTVYIDDILIASSSPEEHVHHLRQLFSVLSKHGLRIHPAKCLLGADQLDFLGHRVSKSGISALPQKVDEMAKFPLPDTVRKMRQFLGVVNYYRRFLPAAASKLQQLTDMTKGCSKHSNKKLVWTKEAQLTFQTIKDEMRTLIMLAHPSPNAATTLATDASATAVGAVLQQEIDGQIVPIAFFSKGLDAAQQKYSTYDRELIAIFLAIRHFSYFLEGRKFAVLTDHRPLTSALTTNSQTLSPRVTRQLAFISQFDCRINHVRGEENTVADALSRSIFSLRPAVHNYEQIANSQATCAELEEFLNPAQKTSLRLKPFQLQSSRILWCDVSTGKQRPFIPADHRLTIFNQLHSVSHPGIRATQRLLSRRVVWPGMNKDIRDWTRVCTACQRSKIIRHVQSPPGALPVPSCRFEMVHVDIVGPLPPSRGHRFLLTCIDRFSRWVEAIPMQDSTAETTLRSFLTSWVSRFGAPQNIITDRGVQFESTLWREAMTVLGTKRSRTTAYHPQSNGLIERVHRRLKEAVKTQPEPHKWVDALPMILLFLHATPTTDTNVSPAEYVYGEDLRLPGEYVSNEPRPSIEHALLSVLRHSEKLRAPDTRKQPPKTTRMPEELQTVDEVLVRVDAVRTGFDNPYQGPYRILRRQDKFFILEKGGSLITVSIDRLKPFHRLPSVHPTPAPRAVPVRPTPVPASRPIPRQEAQRPYVTRAGRLSLPPRRP